MTHALAESTILVEQFVAVSAPSGTYLACPGCGWDAEHSIQTTLGELLTAARRHVLDAHPGGDPLDRQHAYTAVLHAVDNLTGDPYPALIAEEQVPAGDATGRVCEATGNTVRGPLLPYEVVCFWRARRNVSHVADQLPMPPAGGAP